MIHLIYRALRTYNDVRAVRRAYSKGSPTPIARRAGRRVYGKASGALARKLFG